MIDTYVEKKVPVGLDVENEGTLSPELACIYDNFIVKR